MVKLMAEVLDFEIGALNRWNKEKNGMKPAPKLFVVVMFFFQGV